MAQDTNRADFLPGYSGIGQMNHAMLCVPLPEKKDTLWLECTNPSVPLGYRHEDVAGHDVTVAFYTGDDEEEWARYQATSLNVPGITHVWDPEMDSDYQRKYGVLQTPRMFLIGPDGTVVGRGLDTPALRMLTEKLSGKESYVYGTREGTALYERVFASYGDDLKPEDVLDVAAYVAERTYGEGDAESQTSGASLMEGVARLEK